MSLPTFTAEDWFTLEGRGDVAAVRNDRRRPRDQLLTDLRRVVIDGEEYEVIGVESWAIDPIREGAPIGLLVKGGRRSQRRDERTGG